MKDFRHFPLRAGKSFDPNYPQAIQNQQEEDNEYTQGRDIPLPQREDY